MHLLLCSWVLLLVTTVVGQDSRNIKTDKIEGVICTNFAAWKSIVPATEFWTPTKDDVLAAEPQIEAYLKRDSKNLRTPICGTSCPVTNGSTSALWSTATNESSVASFASFQPGR